MSYLTFPVVILKEGFADIKNSVNNAMFYCLYDYCQRNSGGRESLIKDAESFYGITYGNKKRAYDSGKMLFDSIPTGSPKTSISKDMLFDFYKNDKSKFEVVSFLAFAALRSILQRQSYIKVTNDYLLGRMAGNSKKGEPLSDWINSYKSRYQLDKIKLELQANWGLKLYANHTRGFYVSFSLPLEQLVMKAELKRKRYKEKQLAEAKNQARLKALESIYGTAQ